MRAAAAEPQVPPAHHPCAWWLPPVSAVGPRASAHEGGAGLWRFSGPRAIPLRPSERLRAAAASGSSEGIAKGGSFTDISIQTFETQSCEIKASPDF